MKISRAILLGGTALVAVMAIAADRPAQAQVQMPGWFGSATGWYYPWNSTGSYFVLTDDSGPVRSRPADGPGGRLYAGYRFSNPYDIALGVQGSWLSTGKSGTLSAGPDEFFKIRQKAWYWAGDVEVGYNGNDGKLFGYRLFIGARYAEFRHTVSGREVDTASPGGFPISVKDKFHGVGPRIGMSGAYRFAPGSMLSVFGDVSGSYLMGGHRAKTISDEGNSGNGKSAKNAWNVEGQLGIAYEVAPNVNIAIGYRGEYWSDVAFRTIDKDDAFEVHGNAHRLLHGPFARISYNIGAPRGAPMPVAAPAPAPVAQSTGSFIIFFDWDRSDLTPQAKGTVKQASDAFKARGTARVNVTGHADRSGSDQYNMALSLRRANNTKDELVRNGVPANAIMIVGRGETQPLVPTADGVREPQNRRVEIVLN